MTERWKAYVTEGVRQAGGPVPFALTQWMFLFPIFAAIRRALPSGGRVLDIGCGAGIFAALLSHHGYDVVGVDEDMDIVRYAHEMIGFFRASARVEQGNAFELTRFYAQFDLVFSLGVIEHFAPQSTVTLIAEQARCAPQVLVAVPTRYTRYTGPITDERLYRREQVSALVRRAGLHVLETFVYGDIPSWTARALSRALPKALYLGLRHFLSYGMGICCVGEVPAARRPAFLHLDHQ